MLGSVPHRFREDAHQRMRDAALDAAAEDVVARGWDGLQMRAIAQRLGVSRQTLYNTFTSKHGLAEALIMRTTREFLDGVEAAMREHEDLVASVRAAVAFSLRRTETDRLFRAYLTGDSSQEFLPLLTSDGGPVVVAGRDRVAATLLDQHPALDTDAASAAAELVVRLTLSHMLSPLHPHDVVADLVAAATLGYLDRAPVSATR